MIQKAILPLNRARVTAGYKNATYRAEMGFTHYGVDMTDADRANLEVIASFDMVIVASGYDNLMGNTIIAKSVNDVDIHNGAKAGARKLVIRMAHLSKILVKNGETIKKGEVIAHYGSTGTYGGANHLHVEIDTDTSYPTYSPTLAGTSNIWKGGTDSTIHPMDVFKVGVEQEFYISKASGSWVNLDSDGTTINGGGDIIVAKYRY